MAKVIDLGLAGPDDPIYSGGPQVHFKPPLTRSTGDTPKNPAGAPQPEATEKDPMRPARKGLEEVLRKGLEEANPGMEIDPSTGELVPIASKP
jgi:hypothetical protein